MLNHGRARRHGQAGDPARRPGLRARPGAQLRANPPGYDPRYHFQLAIDAGCNAYAAPLGFLEAGAAEFAGEIPLILKLNNHDSLYDEKDPRLAPSPAASRTRCGWAAPPSASRSTPARRAQRRCTSSSASSSEEAKAQGSPSWCGPTRAAPASQQGRRDGDRRRRLRRADRRPARRARHQGQAADGAHRAGRGEEGLREGRGSRSRPSPSACATSCSRAFNGKRIVIFSGGAAKGRRGVPRRGAAASATAAASAPSSAATRSSARATRRSSSCRR